MEPCRRRGSVGPSVLRWSGWAETSLTLVGFSECSRDLLPRMWLVDLQHQHCLGQCERYTFCTSPQPYRSETLGVGPRNLSCNKTARQYWCCSSLRTTGPEQEMYFIVLTLKSEIINILLLLYKWYNVPLEKLGIAKENLRKVPTALAGWLCWLEHHPIHQKVTGLVPSQDAY